MVPVVAIADGCRHDSVAELKTQKKSSGAQEVLYSTYTTLHSIHTAFAATPPYPTPFHLLPAATTTACELFGTWTKILGRSGASPSDLVYIYIYIYSY